MTRIEWEHEKTIAGLYAQLAGAQAHVGRLQNWVNDLQAGMYINCVYCGHRYGPDSEVPATMAEVLKQHIEQCPEHPCSKLKARVEELKAENGRLRDVLRLAKGMIQAGETMTDVAQDMFDAALAPAPPADALAAGYQANAEQAQAECAVWGGDARLEAMEAVCKAARNSHAQPQNVAMWNALGDALAALDREGTDATN